MNCFRGAVKKQPHIVNARQRLYDLFAKLDCRERPIFTVKSGGAQATTHLSSPEHPSESFRREVRVANSVLRANDHRDVRNKTGAVFLQPLFSLDFFNFVLAYSTLFCYTTTQYIDKIIRKRGRSWVR